MTQQPQTPQDLLGKTAVVTGSTDGIGLATAEALLARGANVMFNGLFFDKKDGATAEQQRTEFNQEIALMLSKYPGRKARLFEANVTDPEAVENLMTATAELGDGKIDILVNNAGIQRVFPVDKMSPKDFSDVIDTNLKGAFYATHYAAKYMKIAHERDKKSFPSIINIGSVHSHVGSPGRAAYCAAKAGVLNLTRSAAADLAEYGIRVNEVDPAFVKTALAMAPVEAEAKKIQERTGLDEEAAMEQALNWRLQLQNNQWIEMDTLTGTVCDIASGTLKVRTGGEVLLDNGYVEKAKKAGYMAFFEKAAEFVVKKLNGFIGLDQAPARAA